MDIVITPSSNKELFYLKYKKLLWWLDHNMQLSYMKKGYKSVMLWSTFKNKFSACHFFTGGSTKHKSKAIYRELW